MLSYSQHAMCALARLGVESDRHQSGQLDVLTDKMNQLQVEYSDLKASFDDQSQHLEHVQRSKSEAEAHISSLKSDITSIRGALREQQSQYDQETESVKKQSESQREALVNLQRDYAVLRINLPNSSDSYKHNARIAKLREIWLNGNLKNFLQSKTASISKPSNSKNNKKKSNP